MCVPTNAISLWMRKLFTTALSTCFPGNREIFDESIREEHQTPPMLLVYCLTGSGTGNSLLDQVPSGLLTRRCTLCPLFALCIVEHMVTSRVSFHFTDSR